MGLERSRLRMLFGPTRERKFQPVSSRREVCVSNWNGEHTCRAGRVAVPESPQALAEIVRQAASAGQPIRAVGSLHSVTTAPLVAEGGTVVSTERLNQIGAISGDRATFGAGVTLREACQTLKPLGKQLRCLPLTDQFHLGAISGTQFHDALAFNAGVVEIKYVASDGSLNVVDDEQELFYWRNSHGLFGMVYEVTFEVAEARPIQVRGDRITMDAFVDSLHDVPPDCRRVSGLYDPYHDDVISCNDFYLAPEKMPCTRSLKNCIHQWIWQRLLPVYGFVMPSVSGRTRRLQEHACRLLLGKGFVVHPGDRPMSIRNWGPSAICQLAFPLANVPEFLVEFRQLCEEYRRTRGWQLAQPVVMVWVEQDRRSVFSLSYDQAVLAFDVMHAPHDDPVWREFRDAYLSMAIERHGGRAHLCKTSGTVTPEQALNFVPPERIAEFKRRIDPTLLNPYFESIFDMRRATLPQATSVAVGLDGG